MALDALTMLTLTVALAAAAAVYLAIEWHTARESSLLFWSAGFATITLGSTLALLRVNGLVLVGVWFANGLLVTAHWLFLMGVARFTEIRLSRAWYLIFALWLALLLLPRASWWSGVMLAVNSLLVAVLMLRACLLLRRRSGLLGAGEAQLRYVLMGHGLFYLVKATAALVPGTQVDLTLFRGGIIHASLIEGVMATMLIALSMTGTVRHRREKRIERLAASDPLTALYNRRAFEARAPRLLERVSADRPGAVLLIDIDNFKLVNDLYGHADGDWLLVALSEMIRSAAPEGALAVRLGGDEFAILLDDVPSEKVMQLGDLLRRQFHELAVQTFDTPEAVTLSIGARLFERPPASLAALIEQGDIALYEAKRGGRNCIRVATEAAR